ncbi:ankyrin repeat and KH domain-containing protein R11A8.7 [Austrofundulus limnaeus]|uniref:Ankyrin repeat and KH domain-containing protein R11A8.7 n=1 Tax=Austrofundulus limnaeus TaxID=52670 RepID=A0A2I4BCA3_AUSLI|nr:PREDICTED: ankyrin repeat and KH domain-containing protein R11A8.7-like [Austrofundulus limnaeus]
MFRTKADEQSGAQILLEAMSKDKVHLARFVLDALDGGIVDSRTDGAQTPLISSILLPDGQARCKFAELLLQKGASVNNQDGTGRTALSYACEQGCLDAVKILVRNGADPEVEDSWGNTALMYAAAAGHSSVVEFLVRAFKRLGLQVDRQNKAGNSAAGVANFLGHSECVSALISGKSRGAGGDDQRALENEFEKKVGDLANKLEDLQTRDRALMVQNSTWRPRPRLKQNRLQSMDPIGESPLVPQLTSRKNSQQFLVTPGEHLPPLVQKPPFPSPQPNRNTTLEVLLTPIPPQKCETDGRKEKHVAVRLNESYYRKRCSLPTSMLCPTPPERAPLPLSKLRPVRRREEPPTSAATALSALSNKLLRRFTSPEIKKDHRDPEQEQSSSRMSRSETFPQAQRHPQVDSTPSIDSISSVKCEFDFHLRKPNSMS